MKNLLDLIGQTPLIKLSRFNSTFRFNLYAKCEMFNPSLSIKDRIVLSIIRQLEQTGELQPGGTIVEASSGNTGASLAMIAAILDYKAIITVPEKISAEKLQTIKSFGASVIVCPKNTSPDSPDHYMNKAKQLTSAIPNAVLLGQYERYSHVEAHYSQTAQEIWAQMKGKIDYFVATASSGGTITGIAKFLKEKNPNIKIILADPKGSIFFHYFKNKNTRFIPSGYKVEGAGKDQVCSIHDFEIIDDVLVFSDEDAFLAVDRLAKTEGLLAGGSSGGVLSVVEVLDNHDMRNKNVVVILPDSGFKYLSMQSSIFASS